MSFSVALADRVYVLEKGRIRYQGPAAELRADDALRQDSSDSRSAAPVGDLPTAARRADEAGNGGAGRRHSRLLHDLLGERLGALESRRGGGGSEGGDAGVGQGVHQPAHQRRLGPHHHQVDVIGSQ